jgi:hypothetical protein
MPLTTSIDRRVFLAPAQPVEIYNRKFFAITTPMLEARFVVTVILTPGVCVGRLASTR